MWILAQTKSKREKTAEINIKNQGFKVFLPTIRCRKFSNSKWIDVTEMLFPGYIFINIMDNEAKIGSLSYTMGILKILIDNIININSININDIKSGSRINITKGNSVLSGIFLEKKGPKRAAILLNILNDSREVIVDYADVQPIFY
jgi:transcriptional antiterminator RfaH